jgi:hypothetical protein
LRKIGSAPSIARCSPSVFSCVEKYGEKKNTCSCRSPSSASANSPSCSRTTSSLSWSSAASNRERA